MSRQASDGVTEGTASGLSLWPWTVSQGQPYVSLTIAGVPNMTSVFAFSENYKGLALALSSSLFIGSSFIIKKLGLKKAARDSGESAGDGGFAYLAEPLWWIGMVTMIVGEAANFAALAFAPAILVTPLGALSIIVSAILAQIFLKETLHKVGIAGCMLIVLGSTVIVLHAPPERQIDSVDEIWHLASQVGFLCYIGIASAIVIALVFYFAPIYGHSHILFYLAICSLMGSLSVVCAKALGIAVKLTVSGKNQFKNWRMVPFTVGLLICVLTQLNYLNKALDTFNTAVVSPIYYAMFTSLTILASAIMFRDWENQSAVQIATALCGFATILGGTYLLHTTKDFGDSSPNIGGYAGLHANSLARHMLASSADSRTSSTNERPIQSTPSVLI